MADLRERLGELGERRDAVSAAADRAVALELDWALARDARDEKADELRLAVEAARAEQRALSDELDAAIEAALDGMSQDEVLGVLDPGVPLVLLPVGIETRFTYVEDEPDQPARPDELLIRVLPDEIHVQSHEPELTDGELRLGRDYWTAFFRAGRDAGREAAAWTLLAGGLGPARAAWVKAQLTPANLSERPAAPLRDDDPLAPEPALPDINRRRAGGWTRPAVAGTLPDRWLAIGWQGAEPAFTVAGNVVPDELQIGPSPHHPADGPWAGGEVVEPAMRWLVDFEEAERVGMGIRVKLADLDLDLDRAPLLRRLGVVGISASMDPQRSSQRLAALVEDHAHTEGLGFLPIGTPTNNTAGDSTAWTARPGADSPQPAERDPDAMHPQANAPLAARALGLERAQLASVPFADGRDQIDADAIQTLLWSATGGYLIDHLWRDDKHGGEIFDPTTRAFLRHHFTEYVRARGPLPTLRVGSQPYGLLPATSIARWVPGPEGSRLASLVEVLRAALVLWTRAIEKVPSVTRRSDPDALEALGIAPVSQSVHVRAVAGGNRMSLTHQFERGPNDSLRPELAASAQVMVSTFLAAAGFPETQFPPLYAAKDAQRLWLPLAAPREGGADEQVEAVASFLEHVMDDRMLVRAVLDDDPSTLLTALGRYAATLELVLAAEEHEAVKKFGPVRDGEIFVGSFDSVATKVELAPTALAALQTRLPSGALLGSELIEMATSRLPDVVALISSTPIGEAVVSLFPESPATARSAAVAASAAQLGAGLRERHAAGRDALGGLERLVGEALDLWSHRLDAWLTSIATRRLDALRDARADGVQLGGYGYVENLSPAGAPLAAREDDEGKLFRPVHADGTLLAPSLDQAVTAAILRSGQLTHRADGALAVDLPSDRARLASEIVEGVREGQPLGALIGYRIERRLHDRGAEPGLEILNAVIADLRRIAGLPAAELPPAEQAPAEAISAHSVTDGLRLLEDGVAAVIEAVETPLSGDASTALREVLDEAARDVDAVADLLLAESVFQLSTGRSDRVAATLDALAGRGPLPGEPDVLRTPRRGTQITTRVVLAMPANATAASWGWPVDGARAQAEPRLDAWAASVLGDPSRVRFEIAELDDDEQLAALPEDRWSPASLPVGPGAPGALDLLALAAASGELAGGPVELPSLPLLLSIAPVGAGRRAVRPAPALAADDEGITLLELFALARAAAGVLAASRDPAPSELGIDLAQTGPPGWDEAAVSELQARAANAREQLDELAGKLEAAPSATATIATALRFGIAGAGDAAALASGDAATAALMRDAAVTRLAQADELLASPDDAPGSGAEVQRLVDALQAIFGPGVRAVPVSRPPHVDDLIESAEGLFGDGSRAPDVRDWLDRAATARPGCGALADLLLQAGALPATGSGAPALVAAQTPYVEGDSWLGEADPKPRIASDPQAIPTMLAVHGMLPGIGEQVALLVVDEWNEVVPAAEANAGLAFSYDAPGARPPQAILLAAHPVPGAAWDLATLGSVLDETATLAQVRMVDLEAVSMMGAVLPALYAAQDAIGKAPKLPIDLLDSRLADMGILGDMVEHLSEREA